MIVRRKTVEHWKSTAYLQGYEAGLNTGTKNGKKTGYKTGYESGKRHKYKAYEARIYRIAEWLAEPIESERHQIKGMPLLSIHRMNYLREKFEKEFGAQKDTADD